MDFDKLFSQSIVIITVLAILYVAYLEVRPICLKRDLVREVRAIITPSTCNNSHCVKSIYEKLDLEKNRDLCKFINYGE